MKNYGALLDKRFFFGRVVIYSYQKLHRFNQWYPTIAFNKNWFNVKWLGHIILQWEK